MKDDLDSLLKTWKPGLPEPVAFKRHVWSRIEREEIRRSGGLQRFPCMASTRPQIASLCGGPFGPGRRLDRLRNGGSKRSSRIPACRQIPTLRSP